MQHSALSDTTMDVLGEFVGLELSAARKQALLPVFNDMVLPMLASLDAVDVGETPPVHTFDARWEGEP